MCLCYWLLFICFYSLVYETLAAVSRCQDGSGNGSSNTQLDQRFLLKWSVPLSFVEVLEFGSSEDMADSSHYPTPHSGEKVVINAKPSMNRSRLIELLWKRHLLAFVGSSLNYVGKWCLLLIIDRIWSCRSGANPICPSTLCAWWLVNEALSCNLR